MQDPQIKKKAFGEHLTPTEIFKRYILPEIKDKLHEFIWVDMFAGEGNLILPILEEIPIEDRVRFFKRHIFLFDIQSEMIKRAIKNAIKYGIPENIAKENIKQRDTLLDYPKFLLNRDLPVYHITNPPYLYIGHIKKHPKLKHLLKYFRGINEGYQDLYQIALINDLRHGIKKLIYIIPSNFLFGFSVSNKIRMDFLKYYLIRKVIIFEKEIFESTGTNVIIVFFERKQVPKHEPQSFIGIKIKNNKKYNKKYKLIPANYYRAGTEFEEFVNVFQAKKPLEVEFYLTIDDIKKNPGNYKITAIDANSYDGRQYKTISLFVNIKLYRKIKSNILFLRTLDTGKIDGKAGLYEIRKVFGVDAIVVTRAKYRTHPIQLFINPILSYEEQLLLKDYFNTILDYFRQKTDSEFMTTYKYSSSQYTRKYLGLNQAKKLIKTFPWLDLNRQEKDELAELIKSKNAKAILAFIRRKKEKRGILAWL